MRTYRTFCKEQNDPSRSLNAVDLSPCKLKKRDAALDTQPDFSVTSSRLRSKEETDFWRFGFFPFVLIDRVEVCMAEKGYRYGVFFAARNESELEGRAFLCEKKRQRTRDSPLGSCTCRAREPVPIPWVTAGMCGAASAVSACRRQVVHSSVHGSSGTTTGIGLSARSRCIVSLLRDRGTWCALFVRSSGTWTDGAACGRYV